MERELDNFSSGRKCKILASPKYSCTCAAATWPYRFQKARIHNDQISLQVNESILLGVKSDV